MNYLDHAIRINTDMYGFVKMKIKGVLKETLLAGLAAQYSYLQEMEDKMKKTATKKVKKATKTAKKK